MTYMTEALNDAFPVQEITDGGWSRSSTGLTKREFFAALAMAGLLTKEDETLDEIAKAAVLTADYLIAALNAQ